MLEGLELKSPVDDYTFNRNYRIISPILKL